MNHLKLFLLFSIFQLSIQASDPVGYLLYKKLYTAFERGDVLPTYLEPRVKELIAYREPDLRSKKGIVKIAIFKNDKEFKEVNHIEKYQGLSNYLPVNAYNYNVHYHYFVDAEQIFLARSLETAFPLLKVFEVLDGGWLKIKVGNKFLYVPKNDDFYFNEDLMNIIKHTDRKLSDSMYNHCEDKFHKVPPLFEKLPKKKVFIRGYYLEKYNFHNKNGEVKMSVTIGSKLTNFKDEDKAEARKKSDTHFSYADIEFVISYKEFEKCFDPFSTDEYNW